MQYDPLKDRVARVIKLFPAARMLFYRLMDLFLLRQRYVKKYIQKYCGGLPKLRYYDAGAGFCQYSWSILNKLGQSQVFASDLKAEYLEDFAHFLKPPLAARFSWQAADLQTFTPSAEYDLVTAIDILEHIEDDISTLQNFHHCLALGGMLIISTPSDTDPAAKFTEEHVRPGYRKTELEEKLRNCGFAIRESLFSYGVWGGLAWRLLIKYPLSLLSQSKLALIILPFYLLLVFPLAQLLMYLDLRWKNKAGTGIIIVAQKI